MGKTEVFFSSLGSGSSGNAFFVESAKGALLIDQGFSRKELLNRMEKCGCDPAKLCGALLTHEHSDHSAGARVFCDMFDLPLYATPETIMRLRANRNLPRMVRAFEPGAKFEIGGFDVASFPLSHDVDTVGFQLRYGELQIGIATDLGCVNETVKRHLRNCHALVIESNYDREMLMNSQRRLELKRRILGFRGHLGNLETAGLLGELLGESSRLLLLAHVSRECNDYDMLAGLCAGRLQELNRTDCRFQVLRQDEPSEKFVISALPQGVDKMA
ncbi:MAG: MBL fold metallo-hydrolase [Lentisphaerae bacterium]|nr:MBL fold metallo-hydrolase [Lentisphaerota bacterium]